MCVTVSVTVQVHAGRCDNELAGVGENRAAKTIRISANYGRLEI